MRHLLEHGADALGLSPTQLGALSAAFKGEEDVDMDGGEEENPSVGSPAAQPPRVRLRLRMYAAADENLTIDELVDMKEGVDVDARDEPTPGTQRQSFEFAEDNVR